MAVIDLYFKIKAPTIAATFDRSNVLNSLATNLLSFFSEPTSRFYSEHFDERCEHLAGVYVSLQHFAQPAIKDAFIESDTLRFALPVFMIKHLPKRPYCVVHRLEWPISSSIFAAESPQHKSAERFQHWLAKKSIPAKVVYSGIGIPCNFDNQLHSFNLSITLRDRVTQNPYNTMISIPPSDSLEDEDYSGILIEHYTKGFVADKLAKFGDKEYNRHNINKDVYSDIFIEDIFNIYNDLEEEI